jgi:hypothetical protein
MIGFLAGLLLLAQPTSAPPPACTAAESIETSVTEIAGDPDRFLDRCVTVTGAMAGISLYSGREGMYLSHRFGPDGNYVPEARVHRIGIDRQDLRALGLAYPQRTTVTGRVDTCERRYARIEAAGGMPLLGGYCHYHRGPTIVVDAYSVTEQRYERMTGEAARARFGDLAFMPQNWPTRRAAEAVIAEFLAALRDGDRAKLADLHEFVDEENRHRQGVLFSMLEDPHSVFAGLRREVPLQTAYFVLAAEDGTLFGRDYEGPSATVCFCRTADCTGLWPISLNDANNAPDRPYACTKIESRDYRPGRPVLTTFIAGGWLTEPVATAMAEP